MLMVIMTIHMTRAVDKTKKKEDENKTKIASNKTFHLSFTLRET